MQYKKYKNNCLESYQLIMRIGIEKDSKVAFI